MQHYGSLEEIHLANSWLTIGSFDGVHRGHQAILKTLVDGAHAAGVPAVALTFFPHPAAVLRNRLEPFYLSSPEERADLLGDSGVDVVITHPFNLQVAGMSAHDFMSRVHRHLHPSHLWVGHDFALGRNREGDVDRLRQLGSDFTYSLDVMPPVQLDGETISSSQVRAALAAGDIQRVERMLGRPYQVSGEIVQGDGRGRLLGIPTANLDVWAKRALPKFGIYVCKAYIDGLEWGAVTNVGVRPTFENQTTTPIVEAYIMEMDKDLYGKQLRLDFILYLRDEQRFPSVQSLVDQMHRDIAQARQVLNR
jgi:riboflavin kinase/FMN adenylyltransferase